MTEPDRVVEPGLPPLERAFSEQAIEGELPVIRVDGEIPDGLAGTARWVAPGRFVVGDLRYRNWLDGDGMVFAARFSPGRVEARQQFVETDKVREERQAGRPLWRTFGTSFPGDRLVRGVAIASPVNLGPWPFDGHLLAFGEQGLPWALDPRTLASRGPWTGGGALNPVTPFSGHPKLDPETGELVTFGVGFSPDRPSVTLFRFAADGSLALRSRIPLPWPASIHDFALAGRHAVFQVSPHLLDLHRIRDGATVLEALSWEPERGSRLLVLDRETGRPCFDAPCGDRYCLHLVNAFESAPGRLVVDLVELDRPVYDQYHGLPDLYVDVPAARPVRWVLDLEAGAIDDRTEIEVAGSPEFPTFDRSLTGASAEECWMLSIGAAERPGRKFFDRLVRVDWSERREADAWSAPPGLFPAGEPVFAPVVDQDAVLLVPLWDPAADASRLALFDPWNLAAGPRAEIHLDRRVPLAFHGTWEGIAPGPRSPVASRMARG